MSTDPPAPRIDGPAAQLPPPSQSHTDGLSASAAAEELTERRVDEIEMIGEEQAAQLPPPGHSGVTVGMRYLHSSRTIHQLVTDRNRAVGIYLAVASLLYTASTALLNAKPTTVLFVPIEELQRWCLPVTFGVLSVMALLVGLLLVRTRVGLIYEVAKMNALLGLPSGRVQRVNPLSIFFLMHLLISAAGGLSACLFSLQMLYDDGHKGGALTWSILIGCGITLLLVLLYIGMVVYTTSDKKLQGTEQMNRGVRG
jgi:hypothetical protein